MGYVGSSNMIMFWLITLMTAVVTFPVIHGQTSQGFISIDCGLGKNSTYTDDTTKITYESDIQYIDRGVDYSVSSVYLTSSLDAPLSNLRSFPDGTRNCYTLGPVVKYNKYLIRATFYYGNYDGLQSANTVKPLMFDLLLDAEYWVTVKITDAGARYWKEIVTVAKSNSISVCLINIGNGTPFISALELRPLQMDMYRYANVTQSLAIVYRSNLGSTSTVR